MAIPQQPLVSALIALQFVSFGWRLNREITVGDGKRKTWLPMPDYLNVLSLLAIIAICVVIPLAGGKCDRLANAALVAGYVLIAFHPINEAAHYRLFSGKGRSSTSVNRTAIIPGLRIRKYFLSSLRSSSVVSLGMLHGTLEHRHSGLFQAVCRIYIPQLTCNFPMLA